MGKNGKVYYNWVHATAYTPDGTCIANLKDFGCVFNGKPEILGEFVVLSLNAEVVSEDETCKLLPPNDQVCKTMSHAGGCKHIQSHNIMLIEWSQGIAHRRGLGTVEVGAWENVETREKKIVLG